ncbi:MAG: RNA polymerase sigma factor [Actinomycetota bacterium]
MGNVVRLDEESHSDAAVRFQTIYERHYGHIHAYCRRRVAPERVDDVVAETFLTAWRRRDDLDERSDALPWLYRVAYRVVGHQWRANSRRRRLDERLSAVRPTTDVSPEDATVHREEVDRVLAAAQQLRPDDAELLRLATWERLAPREIATILDISANTVSKRIQRAKESLAHEYERLERTSERRTTDLGKGGTS